MRPTLRSCASVAHTHKPQIHFLGKRQWLAAPSPPAPHPAGPADYKVHFSEFLDKFKANQTRLSSSTMSTPTFSASAAAVRSGKPAATATASDHGGKTKGYRMAYDQFLKAPVRLTSVRRLRDDEIEAIQTGGASML